VETSETFTPNEPATFGRNGESLEETLRGPNENNSPKREAGGEAMRDLAQWDGRGGCKKKLGEPGVRRRIKNRKRGIAIF